MSSSSVYVGPWVSRNALAIIILLVCVLAGSVFVNFRLASTTSPSHPTLSIWTLQQNITSRGLVHGVPDTFDYFIRYTSDVPVGVAILDVDQYVQFGNCPGSDATTRLGCVTGAYASFPMTTSQNQVFTLAEGCGAYLALYYSSANGLFRPNISIQYNPTNGQLTGICKSAP